MFASLPPVTFSFHLLFPRPLPFSFTPLDRSWFFSEYFKRLQLECSHPRAHPARWRHLEARGFSLRTIECLSEKGPGRGVISSKHLFFKWGNWGQIEGEWFNRDHVINWDRFLPPKFYSKMSLPLETLLLLYFFFTHLKNHQIRVLAKIRKSLTQW